MAVNIAERRKKIISAVAVAVAVCLFFIWLGIGIYVSVPIEARDGWMPMFALYLAFPIIVVVVSVRRIREVFIDTEDVQDAEWVALDDKKSEQK